MIFLDTNSGNMHTAVSCFLLHNENVRLPWETQTRYN